MPTRKPAVHVVTTKRRYKDRVYTTHLLRRSYRADGKVRNTTVGNLSHLPEPVIDLVRRALRGETLVPAEAALQVLRSRPHGHVAAVLGTLRALGLERLLGARRSRERDLCLALIAARVLAPGSKLATARTLDAESATSTLGRGAGAGGGGGRGPVCGDGLAGAAPGADRDGARPAAPAGGDAGALRRVLELPRGAVLPARAPRPLARREEGQAADRLRAAVQRRGVPGGGRGVRRQHRRPGHARGPDPQGAHPLRPRARGVRRRPGDADERAPRRGAPPGRGAGLGLGAPQQRDRPAGARPGAAAAVAVRHPRPRRDPPPGLPRRAPGRPASTRCCATSAGAGARRCWRPPRRTWRRSCARRRGAPARR